MGGFDNDCLFFSGGMDTRGLDPTTNPVVNQMVADGQLLIGAAVAPYIRAANLASAGGTVTITNGAGTINLEAGAAVPTSFVAEDASSATPALNILNIVGTSTNGINTTAAGNTVTVSMGDNLYGDFAFINLAPATERLVYIANTDTDAASTAEFRLSVPPAGADAMIVWEIMGSSFYSIGVDNSDSDNWKITNSSDTSSGDDLFSLTNAGVITLHNDLDVTEGGTGVSTFTSHGILIGNGANDLQVTAEPSDGQLLIGSTGNTPSLATLTAGTNIGITNAAGSITINQTTASGGLFWSNIGASGNLVVGSGYVCTAGAALSFALPATSAVGTEVAISLAGSTSWTITQGANQYIRFGNSLTTVGAGGSLASTSAGDTVHLVCMEANLGWVVISSIGNITIV